jgi:hypothetical protein
MMIVNMRLKSLFLGLSIIAAAPVATTQAQDVYPTNVLMNFANEHRVAVGLFFATWATFNARLQTRKKEDFKLADLRADFQELLDSLNIFDTKLYKQLLYMFDKYVIGLPVKIEDKMTRVKKNDEIITVKGKVLQQKPFGLYGLTDAYALTPLKKLVEYLAPVAATYVLIVNPIASLSKAAGTSK